VSSSVAEGDRVAVRDRPCRVARLTRVAGDRTVLELEALDEFEPRRLSVVTPPEEIAPLGPEPPTLDGAGFDSFPAWSTLHRLIAATAVRETGVLTGARFGRVQIETYQLAPALRLLAKPRPSLLIADDVGLGKTIESGLALLELMARGRANRVLIVAPPGLLDQWRDELREKFGLDFALIENATGLARIQSELPAGVNPWDALPRVLTSIDYLKKEAVRGRALRKRWDLVIVDEAHALAESGTPRNPYRTQRTRLGAALRDSGRGLLLLTATPHNGYAHSFRSLLELVEPTAATLEGDPQQIQRRVGGVMIRRLKAQIHRRTADGGEEVVFPPRAVRGIPVAAADAGHAELLREIGSYCSRTARNARGAEDEDLVTFAMQIVKKRALSSRKALAATLEHRLEALRKEEERETPPPASELRDLQADLPLGEAAAERTARRLLRSAIPKDERRRKAEIRALNQIRKRLRGLSGPDPKIDALAHHLSTILGDDPTEKVIVFTEYRDTLAALCERIDATRELAGRYVTLTGGRTRRQRLRTLAAFEAPEVRLLLATDAASEGLNLQRTCRRVVHFELPWNPNRLEQRNGRVDRYGQTRPPIIEYLFHPASPEEDVLHQLVEKIERMQADRVSTPDILGVLAGAGEVERGLVDLDPEAADVEDAKRSLVRHFEDRTREFVRSVQPLLAVEPGSGEEVQRLLDLLGSAESLLADDQELEALMRGLLGAAAFVPTGDEHVFRLNVPLAYRGPAVSAIYPAATFRRSVAIRRKPDAVEYVTPLHPLARAAAAEARRRLVQVWAGTRGVPPRRLAARRTASSAPSAVFTFLGAVEGGAGLLEEHVLAVRLALDGAVVGSPEEALALVSGAGGGGEVRPAEVIQIFRDRFASLSEAAMIAAREALAGRARTIRERRAEQTAVLRADLERDLADRLREIGEEESHARGLVNDAGQRSLFAAEERAAYGFDARRAVAETQAEARREEIACFERVAEVAEPRPMGVLFLLPEAEPGG
jgi:superfamily II DNA or RNA helicase